MFPIRIISVLTLAETGASIKLPYYKDKFDLLFVSGSDRVKEMSVYCGPGATAEVEYELTNPLNVQVAIECISHSGYEVAVDKSAKKITVSAPGRSGCDHRSRERNSGVRFGRRKDRHA